MIVVDSVSKYTAPLFRLLGWLGHKIHAHQVANWRSGIQSDPNMVQIRFDKKDRLNCLRTYDYGDQEYLYEYANSYLSDRLISGLDTCFDGVSDIVRKLRMSYVTSLDYYKKGTLYIYALQRATPGEVVFLIHTRLSSFCARNSGICSPLDVRHIYLPIDDCMRIFLYGWSVARKLAAGTISLRLISTRKRESSAEAGDRARRKTAVVYHLAVDYGGHFRKVHYFSSTPSSALHLSNVICFVAGRVASKDEFGQIHLIPLVPAVSAKDVWKTSVLFLGKLMVVREFREIWGLIYLCSFYIKYLAWSQYFRGSDIKNVIYDYDILFSKPLSLALESLGIGTLAIQERPTTSFGYVCGVSVGTYLYAGRIYRDHGEKNPSLLAHRSISFGQWRTAFFYSDDLCELDRVGIKGGGRPYSDYKRKIVVLGWFISAPDQSPIINPRAVAKFFVDVKRIATDFNECAVILRMKLLGNGDGDFILRHFSRFENIFLCDDYDKMGVSYVLCKHADLIVSVQTSLAEESLAYGKKVIFIDDLYTAKRVCKDIYPEAFHFAIPDSIDGIVQLAERCLDSDEEIDRMYGDLRKRLSGDADLSASNVIADTIEKYLQ